MHEHFFSAEYILHYKEICVVCASYTDIYRFLNNAIFMWVKVPNSNIEQCSKKNKVLNEFFVGIIINVHKVSNYFLLSV